MAYRTVCRACGEKLRLDVEEAASGFYECPACGTKNAVPEDVQVAAQRKQAAERLIEKAKKQAAQDREEEKRRRAEERSAARRERAARIERLAQEELDRRAQESAAWNAMSREMQVKALLAERIHEDTYHSYQAGFQCAHCANLSVTWIPKAVSAAEFVAAKGGELACRHCQHSLTDAKPVPMPKKEEAGWFFFVWWS